MNIIRNEKGSITMIFLALVFSALAVSLISFMYQMKTVQDKYVQFSKTRSDVMSFLDLAKNRIQSDCSTIIDLANNPPIVSTASNTLLPQITTNLQIVLPAGYQQSYLPEARATVFLPQGTQVIQNDGILSIALKTTAKTPFGDRDYSKTAWVQVNLTGGIITGCYAPGSSQALASKWGVPMAKCPDDATCFKEIKDTIAKSVCAVLLGTSNPQPGCEICNPVANPDAATDPICQAGFNAKVPGGAASIQTVLSALNGSG